MTIVTVKPEVIKPQVLKVEYELGLAVLKALRNKYEYEMSSAYSKWEQARSKFEGARDMVWEYEKIKPKA